MATMVNVLSPRGKPGEIDAAKYREWQRAMVAKYGKRGTFASADDAKAANDVLTAEPENAKTLGADLLRGVRQGATLGFADEGAAALGAVGAWAGGDTDLEENYTRLRDYEREENDRSSSRSPVTYTAGQIAGSVPGAIATGGAAGGARGVGGVGQALVPVGQSVVRGKVLPYAAAGVLGAVGGVGHSKAPNNSAAELADATEGALWGVGTQGALEGLANVPNAARAVKEKAKQGLAALPTWTLDAASAAMHPVDTLKKMQTGARESIAAARARKDAPSDPLRSFLPETTNTGSGPKPAITRSSAGRGASPVPEVTDPGALRPVGPLDELTPTPASVPNKTRDATKAALERGKRDVFEEVTEPLGRPPPALDAIARARATADAQAAQAAQAQQTVAAEAQVAAAAETERRAAIAQLGEAQAAQEAAAARAFDAIEDTAPAARMPTSEAGTWLDEAALDPPAWKLATGSLPEGAPAIERIPELGESRPGFKPAGREERELPGVRRQKYDPREPMPVKTDYRKHAEEKHARIDAFDEVQREALGLEGPEVGPPERARPLEALGQPPAPTPRLEGLIREALELVPPAQRDAFVQMARALPPAQAETFLEGSIAQARQARGLPPRGAKEPKTPPEDPDPAPAPQVDKSASVEEGSAAPRGNASGRGVGQRKRVLDDILDAGQIHDHDFARADAAYVAWREGRGPKPPPWEGGELDALRGDKAKAPSSVLEGLERVLPARPRPEDIAKAVERLREVPGLENARVPDHIAEILLRKSVKADAAKPAPAAKPTQGQTETRARLDAIKRLAARDKAAAERRTSFDPEEIERWAAENPPRGALVELEDVKAAKANTKRLEEREASERLNRDYVQRRNRELEEEQRRREAEDFGDDDGPEAGVLDGSERFSANPPGDEWAQIEPVFARAVEAARKSRRPEDVARAADALIDAAAKVERQAWFAPDRPGVSGGVAMSERVRRAREAAAYAKSHARPGEIDGALAHLFGAKADLQLVGELNAKRAPVVDIKAPAKALFSPSEQAKAKPAQAPEGPPAKVLEGSERFKATPAKGEPDKPADIISIRPGARAKAWEPPTAKGRPPALERLRRDFDHDYFPMGPDEVAHVREILETEIAALEKGGALSERVADRIEGARKWITKAQDAARRGEHDEAADRMRTAERMLWDAYE